LIHGTTTSSAGDIVNDLSEQSVGVMRAKRNAEQSAGEDTNDGETNLALFVSEIEIG